MRNNHRYEILTDEGWEDFTGIEYTGYKDVKQLELDDGSIIKATDHHKFFDINDQNIKVKDIDTDTYLKSKDGYSKVNNILSIEDKSPCYDIINVDNEKHSFVANTLISNNCDELAFVRKKIANNFWAAVFPTISCLSPDTIILTSQGFSRIDEFFKDHEVGDYFEIDNLQLWGREGFENVSHGYVSPGSETYIFTLRNGQRVEVTPEHPLWNCAYPSREDGEMVQAQDIDWGTHLLIHKGMNVEGRSSMVPETFWNIFHSNPELLLSIDRISLFNVLDLESDCIRCKTDKQLEIMTQLLNNYGYEYLYNDGYIHITRHVDEFRTEWIQIVKIEKSEQECTYDFTLPKTHTFLQNGILGSNTGGKCIITSTPTTDDSLFANIWRYANKTMDEYGNETEVGINGFSALKVKWDEHPERGDDFKDMNIRQYGEEKFRREHELEFIPEDETLIDPVILSNLERREPIQKSPGEIRWYKKINKNYMYLIGYDPSLGTGGDYSAIEIYEFPSMIQVGEWMHNRSDIPQQLSVLRRILKMFEEAGFDEDSVRWTVENNTVGEAPLVLIDEYGEDEFFGYFMVEPYNPIKKGGQRRRFRKGYNTNGTTKLTGCMRMKRWIENEKMRISSRALIDQLSHFVSRGKTYAAQSGEHDDLVMASLLVVRMGMEIMREEDEYMEELGFTQESSSLDDDEDDDDEIPPLPVY